MTNGNDWRAKVATWPPDFQAAYPLMVESYLRAGHSREAAELGAFQTFAKWARHFAQVDAENTTREALEADRLGAFLAEIVK